jgi:hypothetical protein
MALIFLYLLGVFLAWFARAGKKEDETSLAEEL